MDPVFEEDMSIAEAKDILGEHAADGVECPVCEQFAKVYKRKLSKSHVDTLIQVWVRQNGYDDWPREPWVYLPEIPQKSRDFATTRYFNLAEESEGGFWRVTELGDLFLKGEAEVSKYAFVYNNKRIGYEGKMVDVHEVMGERFDYRELMDI